MAIRRLATIRERGRLTPVSRCQRATGDICQLTGRPAAAWPRDAAHYRHSPAPPPGTARGRISTVASSGVSRTRLQLWQFQDATGLLSRRILSTECRVPCLRIAADILRGRAGGARLPPELPALSASTPAACPGAVLRGRRRLLIALYSSHQCTAGRLPRHKRQPTRLPAAICWSARNLTSARVTHAAAPYTPGARLPALSQAMIAEAVVAAHFDAT